MNLRTNPNIYHKKRFAESSDIIEQYQRAKAAGPLINNVCCTIFNQKQTEMTKLPPEIVLYSIVLNKHYDLIHLINDTYTVRAELNRASKLCRGIE